MKSDFPGYYRPTEDEFRRLWKEGLFVLDTNVLLDLYRFPPSPRDALLTILAGISDRLWLPFHVALEFQRNRMTVIAEQRRRFSEVKEVVTRTRDGLKNGLGPMHLQRRHPTINPDGLIADVERRSNDFLKELDALESAQPDVDTDDPLRARIDAIFAGRVGKAPSNQEQIDKINAEGERRFAVGIPPGYEDERKKRSAEPEYSYGGITYKRVYSDLVIWKEIIAHVAAAGVKVVVLITGDEKPDWLWTIDSAGPKKLGPRPELLEEIRREGRVDLFYIYTLERFLELSREYLSTSVSEASIEQVRDITRQHRSGSEYASGARLFMEQVVVNWIETEYPDTHVEAGRREFPDIVVIDAEGTMRGFDVVRVGQGMMALQRLQDRVFKAYHSVREGGFDLVEIVAVSAEMRHVEQFAHSLGERLRVPAGVGVIFGQIVDDASVDVGYQFDVVRRLRPRGEAPE